MKTDLLLRTVITQKKTQHNVRKQRYLSLSATQQCRQIYSTAKCIILWSSAVFVYVEKLYLFLLRGIYKELN